MYNKYITTFKSSQKILNLTHKSIDIDQKSIVVKLTHLAFIINPTKLISFIQFNIFYKFE